jgi:predicted TIM-barrel fold metal-dependent hydrolase
MSDTRQEGTTPAGSSRIIVVSGDSHVGPRLKEDLREYCPKQYLGEFDAFIEANRETYAEHDRNDSGDPLSGRSTRASEVSKTRQFLNRQTAGHYDVYTRLREMDWDGVASEVIFHGSQNTEVFPFVGRREWGAKSETARDRELIGVGYDMYNRWIADFASVQPERHIALAYVPMWDPELAAKAVEKAAALGLKAVNFQAPRPGIAEYDDPSWEPFWSTCEAHGFNLASHSGLPGHNVFGPQRMAMTRIESAGWPARRGMHRMIFGGVFARYPNLRLTLTEHSRGWWNSTMRELDFVYNTPSEELYRQVPEKPSYYMKNNVFIGASFMPPSEVQDAIADGYADQVLWGRDYPHGEGTYKYPERPDEQSLTRYYLRWAFSGCPAQIAENMLANTPIKAYGLDRAALAAVAERVGPTVDEVTAPIDEFPPDIAAALVDVQTGEMAVTGA